MWQGAHHDYGTWDSAPNAVLLHNNNMFDIIRGGNPAYLAHVTVSLEEIEKEGKIHPSAGCLIGSIYCVPVIQENDKLRLHNLGSYFFLKEARFSEQKAGAIIHPKVSIILFKIDRASGQGRTVEGVNYLRMGDIHLKILEDKPALIGSLEELQESIVTSVEAEEALMQMCVERHTGTQSNMNQNLELLKEISRSVSAKHMPFFGYILFESLSIALMLHQSDDFTLECRNRGEFNNWNYKEIMYDMFPEFGNSFRLSDFAPKWNEIIENVIARGWVPESSRERFVSTIALRARKYICDNCMNSYREFKGFGLRKPRAVNERWELLRQHVRPLLGHMLHRHMRNISTEEYLNMFGWFERQKAVDVWNYWTHRQIALPFNGVIPKGEIGINPAMRNMSVQAYECEVEEKGRDVYVTKGKPLKIKVASDLGSLRRTFRRDNTGI